ncbi:ABC transporter transmembrane domain-containing protein [Paenibacillus thiaminolyticus]|uniref:ABC transporter transmembrane domain-containing protein n=1 Tax=Paenibacillus thiaminolyticus TaxID=49283 RepID=A0ABT4FTM2_PANTH|nr:ABC transporter transmembrane domain-containing protein [Paenibacillus thiaminolyticus]MCY9537571.1 ABC transporter transmembrane domain-containing protein [Paenibacillus thiaminolyticus]MCY9600684.1 ABC transporter transmembrane domain-containing protein [Paenibacillus thiaminolyticus]MCY9607512.1 ABC transporter transmembrane domain-containing protein [Paenibacillus thiaminolyticus]MCY9611312.1 ABC transporter transmembrane domain-containing protein [Paenibacillus thiaminolyticus]MCY96193
MLRKKTENNNPKPKELEQDERYEPIPRASLRQLFALTKGHNLEFILVVILGILSAILTLIQPNLVADLVKQSSSGFTVNITLVLLILVLSVSMILTTIQYYLLQKIGEGVVFEARSNLISHLIQKASFRVQQELGKLSGLVERDLQAIRTIRSTNATSIEENKAKLQAEHLRKLGIRLAKIQSFMTPISNLSLQVCGLIVLGFGGYRVSMGYMTIADLIAFALLLFIMIGPVGQIFGAFSGIGESLGAFARIKELLDLALETDYDTNSTVTFSPNSSAQKGMVLF